MITDCRIKITRLIFLMCLIIVLPTYGFGDEINVRVSNGNDDAEERISDGDMSLGSSDLEMSSDGGSVQAIGLRFNNISIPPGAVITGAYITFIADGNESGDTDLVIYGEDSDDANTFDNDNYDITGRPRTGEFAIWENVDPWNDDSSYQTPDLTFIVHEIINGGGWTSDNDMAFIIVGTGLRRAESYNGNSSDAPLLHIEYTETLVPYIHVNPTTLEPVSLFGENPGSDTFTIANTGSADLNYSLNDDQDWVSFSPGSGILSAGATNSITVEYDDVSSMEPGTYDATITITDGDAPNSPVDINITLEIQASTVEVSVSTDSDDAEEDDSGEIDLSSTDLELVQESTNQIVGIRFQSVGVPQGAMITNAYIEFDVDENVNENPVELYIYGEKADNPGTFTSSDNNISDRDRTDQFIEWNSLPDWNNGEQHQTAELNSIVQAIVGRGGWSSGNSMVFIITGSGKRVAESYDGDGEPPLLHIEYIEGSFPYISVDKNNINALCYEGSNTTEDSVTITNSGDASLSYELTEGSDWLVVSGTGTLAPGNSAEHIITYDTSGLDPGNYNATITVTGTDALNSPYEIDVVLTVLALPESSECGDVPLYAENLVSPAIMVLLDVSSSMTSMMNVNAEVQPKTPDLSTVVQEIVDRGGWQYENSMVFIITGSGHRTASSYNGNSGGAPLLHVEYNDGIDHVISIRVSQGSDDAEEYDSGGMSLNSSDLELVHDSSDQTVGIRFQNVQIPINATITNAYLEFEIDEEQSEDTDLTIHGQAHDNPSEFDDSDHNISDRALTSSSVTWNNIETWETGAQMSRIDIGKEVISDLVTDPDISWGYGTWCAKSETGYTSDIDYTKIHVGCRFNDNDQQTALQNEIDATISHRGTPFYYSIEAAEKYFSGNKNDDEGNGEAYNTVDCQPMFLIDITDGLGWGDIDDVARETNALSDINVTPIAVGFGIDNAVQIKEMAKVSNERGHASNTLYALHEEVDGIGQPFLANNRQELIDTLSGITESIKVLVFHGSAPAPTTSVDQGDIVILAKFNAGNWSGEIEAVALDDSTGNWDDLRWTASEVLPFTRSVFTIDPLNDSDVISYSSLNLANDKYFDPSSDDYFCKPFGSFINSIPIIVGNPSYHYEFDNYQDFAPDRDPMIYIGANDGALHAFFLEEDDNNNGAPGEEDDDDQGDAETHAAGEESWAFVPLNLHDKLNRADEPEYDICGDGYCHQYFVDGSPQVGDIYDNDNSEWKTILACGEGDGGDAYFALDITSGEKFNTGGNPNQYLWQFRDTIHKAYLSDGLDNDGDLIIDEVGEDISEDDNQLGYTDSTVSIDRVADGENNTVWGVFFGSGYSMSDQLNKEAYVYGIQALDKAPMWYDYTENYEINRIKLSDTPLTNDAASSPLLADFEGDDISDKIYVGNLYGTMYRVADIGLNNPDGTTPVVSKFFDFNPSNLSSGVNPVTAKANYAYSEKTGTDVNPLWIYYGTGRFKDQADKTTTDMQYFFGLKDDYDDENTASPRCYLYPYTGADPDSKNPAVCGDLVELEAKYSTVSVTKDGETIVHDVRYIDGTCVENHSWVIKLFNGQADFNGPSDIMGSERVLKQSFVAGGIVFFATFIPDPDICSGNGITWVFAVDYNTGCATEEPVFDLNGDGKFDDNDKIPSGDPNNPIPVVGIPIRGGPGSKLVLGPRGKKVFITTPVGGLNTIDVNIPGLKVKMNSWREGL